MREQPSACFSSLPTDAVPAGMPDPANGATEKAPAYARLAAAAFIILFLAVGLVGFGVYRQLVAGEEQTAHQTLNHIAEIETSAVSAWVDERLGDAQVFSGGGFLGDAVAAWNARGRPDDDGKRRIEEQLNAIKSIYKYHETTIVQPDGSILLSSEKRTGTLDAFGIQTVRHAMEKSGPEFSPIHSAAEMPGMDLPETTRIVDLAARLYKAGNAAPQDSDFVLFLRTDSSLYLEPLIQIASSEETPTQSFLVEARGQHLTVVSDTRNSSYFNFLDTLPVSIADFTASESSGSRLEIRDARNDVLIAVIHRVKGSPWFMMTAMRQSIIHANIDRMAWIVASSGAGLLAMLGGGIWLWWRKKESDYRLRAFQAETAARLLQRQYDYLTRYANDLIVLIDAEGRIMEVNDKVLKTLARERDELLGMPLDALFRTRTDMLAQLTGELRKSGSAVLEFELPQPGGGHICLEVSARIIELDGRRFIPLIGRDVTERRKAEAALRESQGRLNAILESILDVVWSFSPDFSILNYINPSVERIYGYPVEALSENPRLWFDAIHPDDRGKIEGTLRALRPENSSCEAEYRILRSDGQTRWLHCRGHLVADDAGKPVRVDGISTDVTQRKAAEQQVQALAYYDSVTMLPNRALLNDRLSQAMHMATRSRKKVAVLYMDLDNFKNINDSLGHHIGDMLLRSIGERLLQCVRDEDTVARIGGDEFLIVLPDIQRGDQLVAVAEKILATVARPFNLQGNELHTTISIGISVYPDDATERHELIRHADSALYQAKGQGRNAYQFFTQELNYQITRSLTIERQLRRAIDSGELCLWYQPQVDITEGKLIGAEALLRWRHSGHDFLSPVEFIPVAEERGLISKIGEWAIREACRQCRQWQALGLRPIRIAVNVSPIQFQQKGFADMVTGILRETHLDASCLELEITESSIMRRATQVADLAMQLRDVGVGISIDDFGTGYSSLSYLKQIPIDKIKIDRSFISDMLNDPDSEAITYAIISLARSLNLRVIAEGVESKEQLQRLRAFGCTEVQGYYYSCALSADAFQGYLADEQSLLEHAAK